MPSPHRCFVTPSDITTQLPSTDQRDASPNKTHAQKTCLKPACSLLSLRARHRRFVIASRVHLLTKLKKDARQKRKADSSTEETQDTKRRRVNNKDSAAEKQTSEKKRTPEKKQTKKESERERKKREEEEKLAKIRELALEDASNDEWEEEDSNPDALEEGEEVIGMPKDLLVTSHNLDGARVLSFPEETEEKEEGEKLNQFDLK